MSVRARSRRLSPGNLIFARPVEDELGVGREVLDGAEGIGEAIGARQGGPASGVGKVWRGLQDVLTARFAKEDERALSVGRSARFESRRVVSEFGCPVERGRPKTGQAVERG